MRIVAIMGTNRNGRTREVVEKIDSIFQAKGEPAFEYVYLKDKDIRFCTGCHNCIFVGEDRCPLKDDIRGIEETMMEADAVIFASPAYMMNVTAYMKNFLDRVAYHCHRPVFLRQEGFAGVQQQPLRHQGGCQGHAGFRGRRGV